MRKITFDTFDDAIGAVEDFSDGLGCNVTITSEVDGTSVTVRRLQRGCAVIRKMTFNRIWNSSTAGLSVDPSELSR